jgi:hypothetical protein
MSAAAGTKRGDTIQQIIIEEHGAFLKDVASFLAITLFVVGFLMWAY